MTLATLLVVLFGAVVRITGSGAGCGQHWPSCNGEIAHLPRSVETWIELTHRTTSGLDFLGVVALVVVAWKRSPERPDPARLAALGALLLMLVEVAIGARLVLLNLVGSNMSFDRAVVMPAHLVTTSLLLGALGAATYFGSESRVTIDPAASARQLGAIKRAFFWLVLAGVLLLLVSMTGAVTALGDTVYPVQGSSTLEHLRNDRAEGAHFLAKLRVLHPLLALAGVASLWIAARRARGAARAVLVQRLGALLHWGGALALAIGVANIWLGAPGYMQVVHLAMACMLWLDAVVLGCALWDAQAFRKEE
ncbi:MAG TPA: COX15/CtaA family protein [Polyangiaceae bacterium]|nr:COX15/CtaA family protein [Polyangiaceae bacterium]